MVNCFIFDGLDTGPNHLVALIEKDSVSLLNWAEDCACALLKQTPLGSQSKLL